MSVSDQRLFPRSGDPHLPPWRHRRSRSCNLISAQDVVMIVFVQIAIGRLYAGSVRRRTWLGLGGVMLVVGAGLAAYGINSAFGELEQQRLRRVGSSRRGVSIHRMICVQCKMSVFNSMLYLRISWEASLVLHIRRFPFEGCCP